MKKVLLISLAFMASVPFVAAALTVRSKSDLRLWETVTDRASSLPWTWEANADSALLTFSNRLTHAVTSTNVARAAGAVRGACAHPVADAADEGLVDALLIQSSGGAEVCRAAAVLAYVPGVAGRPLTVRTKADREWRRAQTPRLAAFAAAWWEVTGPSGYEILWADPPGMHRVTRALEGVGVVDEVTLRFGTPGFLLFAR